MADLVRSIPVSLQVDFLIVSSYGVGKVSNNEVQLLYIPIVELKGRAVLVVEDIVDSGTTLSRLIPINRSPRPHEHRGMHPTPQKGGATRT
jgi:hypoxanthine phosphoribosyltransferase